MTEGFRLEFVSAPELSIDPPPHALMKEAVSARLELFLPTWLQTGVVREVRSKIPLWYSRLFTRAKKNGKLRPVVDLSELNRLLKVPSFKMETVAVISKAITGVLWACSIDIEDAYFHVPVGWEFHRFLAFRIREKTFVFQFLPFGLSPAPWGFSRVIKPIKRKLHTLLISVFSFLDDFVLFESSPLALQQATGVVLDLLHSLGFKVNWTKSNLAPSQFIEFLGVMWDLQEMVLSVPRDKQVAIRERCNAFRLRETASRREMESLTGLLNFAASYLALGRLHLLPIMLWMNLNTFPLSRDVQVYLDDDLRELLQVWTDPAFLGRSVPMRHPKPTISLMTDASLEGWCGVLLPQKVWGSWPPSVSHLSMNWKELRAVLLSLREFGRQLEGRSIQLLSDNSTTISCLRHQGSVRHPHLHALSAEILLLCRALRISLHPVHLRGVLNVLADQGSRLHPIATEWSLDRTTFAWLRSLVPSLQVDMFATRENTQLPFFVSPCPDPMAAGFDAFSLQWNDWTSIYLMPPLNCMEEVLQRLQDYRGAGLLVAPFWPTKGWFPLLRLRCRGSPLPLPPTVSLSQVTSQGLVVIRSPRFWNLHAWFL